MKFGIVTFPGSNCDYDAYHAVVDGSARRPSYLWHKDHDLAGQRTSIILPGGFSYGDYLRAGAIARFSPIMQEVVAHAERGGPVLAICNGFQIACEAGLLPGALLRNASLKFVSRDGAAARREHRHAVQQRVRDGPGAHACPSRTVTAATRPTRKRSIRLEGEGQVVFRYVGGPGDADEWWNPNGSMRAIAGISQRRGQRARHDAAPRARRRSRSWADPTDSASSNRCWHESRHDAIDHGREGRNGAGRTATRRSVDHAGADRRARFDVRRIRQARRHARPDTDVHRGQDDERGRRT